MVCTRVADVHPQIPCSFSPSLALNHTTDAALGL